MTLTALWLGAGRTYSPRGINLGLLHPRHQVLRTREEINIRWFQRDHGIYFVPFLLYNYIPTGDSRRLPAFCVESCVRAILDILQCISQKQAQMNSEVPRLRKRVAEDGVGGPPLKRKRQNDAAGPMRGAIDIGEGSSMTGSQSTGALSQVDPSSDVIFEEEDLVLPFETPWNARDSKQPIRYLRNYRILSLKSQEVFSMSSIRHTSLEFEEQEELPHFLGLVRYKEGDPRECKERTAKNPELLMLSSKVWRAWWNRDPAAPERYVPPFLLRDIGSICH